MCGIFAYSGKENAVKKVFQGLKKLEYRGYDSWGIGLLKDDKLLIEKHVGSIGETKPTLSEANLAIGHTRWATHGKVNRRNAHPHTSKSGNFILIHNGIVENYQELKNKLENNFKFSTETDTEAIIHLIEKNLQDLENFCEAFRKSFSQLSGRNTILALTSDQEIYAAKNGSPLIVGKKNNNLTEIYFSSDTLSLASQVNKIVPLDNQQMVAWKNQKPTFYSTKTGKKLKLNFQKINLSESKIDKEGYEHFMMKEIHESPYVINQTVNQEIQKLQQAAKAIESANTIYTVGSGTSGIAALQLAFYLRKHASINARALTGAESSEFTPLIDSNDAVISLSQSGETADVLEFLENLDSKPFLISHVNMPGSSMLRMANLPILAHAGPEICVMSTKSYIAQIAWGYLLAKTISGQKKQAQQQLKTTAQTIDQHLNNLNFKQKIQALAEKLAQNQHIFLLGKGQNISTVKEGMIKIIEGSYIHAHGIPAGDLKHYAITIAESGVPVIVVASKDQNYQETINAANEVKAREAYVIGFSPKKEASFSEFIHLPDLKETSAIFNIIPLQLLAYYLAVELGNNVDKPRNIAKSVTVK